ncbi:MAG TPA: Gfo/Idh/MocA family oxidoreductase [Tepidisphaeraceae bacterium]|nr:Gfo/Idh/MocA family oxidoreductase [Tepidisphaeraceae bacterium]
MADRMRWGILTTGNIARQFAAGVGDSRRTVLAAVGSRSKTSADTFAKEYRVPTAYGDYESVISDRSVDAIYNALPNSMHHEWTIKGLKAGKHVLCEKPLAVTPDQAEEMFDVARRQGRVLVEAFMYRAHPLTKAVTDEIKNGVIGEVRLIRTSFVFRTRRIEGNIRFDASLAGGSLMDIGCYCVNFSRLHAGCEPTEIHAVGHIHESGIDDWAAGTMKFPNGVLATFTCGMSAQADNTASICGIDGFIETAVPWKPPVSDATYIIGHSTPPRMDMAAGQTAPPPRQTKSVSAGQSLYGLEADAFAGVVAGDSEPFVSEQDSLANTRILQEMRRQIGLSF